MWHVEIESTEDYGARGPWIHKLYFCSKMVVQSSVLFWRCKVLLYSGGAKFCSIMAVLLSCNKILLRKQCSAIQEVKIKPPE